MYKLNKFILPLFLAVMVVMTGCGNNDDDECDDAICYDVPTTYTFDNVSYSGQTERLDMLAEMTTYMKTANTSGVEITAEMPYMIGAIVYQDLDEGVSADATFEALIQVWRTEPRKLFGLISYKKEVHAPLEDPFVTTLVGIIQALDGIENVRISSG